MPQQRHEERDQRQALTLWPFRCGRRFEHGALVDGRQYRRSNELTALPVSTDAVAVG